MLDIKKTELEDTINSFFEDFNKKIASKTTDEILQFIDEEFEEFLDIQERVFKGLPKDIKIETNKMIVGLKKEIKNKAMD